MTEAPTDWQARAMKPTPPPMRSELKGVSGWLFWPIVAVIFGGLLAALIYG